MKLNLIPTLALCAYGLISLTSCGEKTQDHADHDHGDDHAEHDGDDHDEDGQDHVGEHHDGDEHAEHADHDGEAKKEAGPNGGRLLTKVEPHAEYFVKPDRTVQIAFVNDGNKILAVDQQSVQVFAGDRSAMTTLSFTAKDGVLVSDQPLPEGDDFPVVVQLTMTPGASAVTEKFTMDFSDCPTCEHQEYACICDH